MLLTLLHQNIMKKLCFITTVSATVRSFLLPVLSYYTQHTDWELTVVCDHDPLLQQLLPEGVKYYPISMKRGISLGGIAACWKMYRFFRKEKFDLVQYSTPNAACYASIAARIAIIAIDTSIDDVSINKVIIMLPHKL